VRDNESDEEGDEEAATTETASPPPDDTQQAAVDEDRPILKFTTDCDALLSSSDSDDAKLESFIAAGCGCARECTRRFPVDMIRQSSLDCTECDVYCDQHVNHQHLLLLGAMNSLVHNQPETIQKDHKSQTRCESRSTYMFHGIEVCRKFFSMVFGCGEKRLKNVKKQFLSEGVSARQHGNVHKAVASNDFEKRRGAREFIQNFAENNALVLPG
jgi:hypothetical protein